MVATQLETGERLDSAPLRERNYLIRPGNSQPLRPDALSSSDVLALFTFFD